MAAPSAPMPLRNQVKLGGTITVTVPLRGLGKAPSYVDGGTAFNSGDPNATYTIVLPNPGPIQDGAIETLLDTLDLLVRNTSATVA